LVTILQQAWAWLRDIFSSRVLGTTSAAAPRLDGGLSRPARLSIAAIAVTLALVAGWIAGAPWGADFFFPALMVAGLFGDVLLAALALLACILIAARLFAGLDLRQFAVAATVQTLAALTLRLLFRESRRWGVRYRHALSAMSAAVTVSDDRGRIERPHPEFERLIGRSWPDYAGMGWLECVHPDDHPKFRPAGAPGGATVQRAEIRLKDPTTGDWRWYLMRAVPLLDEDGKLAEWVSTLTDVHEHKLVGEQQDMMIGEARHRLKNLMTIIDSLVKSSRPRDADAGIDAYQKRLLGRLHALSAAGDLALAGNYTTMNVREVIAATLSPFLETESRRLTFDGPDLELSQATGGSLALGVHELTTNAIKHGALSDPEGRVSLTWTVTPIGGARRVEMVWKESGGPQPKEPAKDGFGTRVITFIPSREQNGSVTAEFPADGYVCRIGFTLPDSARTAE